MDEHTKSIRQEWTEFYRTKRRFKRTLAVTADRLGDCPPEFKVALARRIVNPPVAYPNNRLAKAMGWPQVWR